MRSVDDFFLLAEEYEDGDATITNDHRAASRTSCWRAGMRRTPLKRAKIEPRV
jgi:hypothetical protein